jgi:type VI secretion system protein ImpA
VSAHGQTVNRVAAACKALAAEETDVARGLVEGIKASEAAIVALTAKYTEKAGLADGLGLQLPDLSEFLKHARTPLERALAETGGADAPASGGEPAANGPLPAGAEMPAAGSASGTAAVSGPGRLASRSDVEAALDKIVEYYERNEPASPMPYLLRRVRRMVKMDFMELMEEVAPGGVKDFSALAGLKPGGKDEKK